MVFTVIPDIKRIVVNLSVLLDDEHSIDRTIHNFFSIGSENIEVDNSLHFKLNVITRNPTLSSSTSDSEMYDSLKEEFEKPLSSRFFEVYEGNVFSDSFIIDSVTTDHKRKIKRKLETKVFYQ
uniref:Uncharacterized protein n=1 Tax=Strongyloides papillosus TaxID=174720 RepID=A0A0N5BM60_STREA